LLAAQVIATLVQFERAGGSSAPVCIKSIPLCESGQALYTETVCIITVPAAIVTEIDLGKPTMTSAVSTVVKTSETSMVEVVRLRELVGSRSVEEYIPPFRKGSYAAATKLESMRSVHVDRDAVVDFVVATRTQLL
jgi:hypothetical protein